MATYDLLIFQNVRPSGDRLVGLSIGNAGLYCTGIQKVSQSFALFFLTDLGSVKDDPTFGTSFMQDLRRNRIQDESTLAAAFQVAVVDYKNYSYQTQSEDLPEDEQFDTATLVNWSLTPGNLSITTRITTAAGESREYVVPVEIMPS